MPDEALQPRYLARAIEEERRLLYVAMTRAKDLLELMVPQQSMFPKPGAGDGYPLAQVSRFVPASIRDKFETRRWAPKTSYSPGATRTTRGPVVDLVARVGKMWK